MSMTLREVHLAWSAKVDFGWMQTASLMAAVYNIRQRGKNDRRNFTWRDFYRLSSDPERPSETRRQSGTLITKGLLRQLKTALFDENGKARM